MTKKTLNEPHELHAFQPYVKAGQVWPQDSINELIAWKVNSFVVPVPGVEYFTRTSLYLVMLKIFRWIKFLPRHLHQFQGNWGSRNFITASWIHGSLRMNAEINMKYIITNGFNLWIINSLKESWGYAWTGLTVKVIRSAKMKMKMASSIYLLFTCVVSRGRRQLRCVGWSVLFNE